MAMKKNQMQVKPAQPPGQMINRAQGLAIGGRMTNPGKGPTAPDVRPPINTKPFSVPGGSSGTPIVNLPQRQVPLSKPLGEGPGSTPGGVAGGGMGAGMGGQMDPQTALGIRQMGGTPTPPIYIGGQQPGGPPVNSPLQIMDGAPGTFVPGQAGGSISLTPGGMVGPRTDAEIDSMFTPEQNAARAAAARSQNIDPGYSGGGSMNGAPGQMPAGPNMAGGGLNGQPGGGMPPGMQLPPQLQQAVAAGNFSPQQAFDRAMQNRAGFRQQVQQQAQQAQPFGGNPQGQARNLSDMYRNQQQTMMQAGGQPGQFGGMLATKPLPIGGGMQFSPGAGAPAAAAWAGGGPQNGYRY